MDCPFCCQNSRQIPLSPEFRACRLKFCSRSDKPQLNRRPAAKRTSAVVSELLHNPRRSSGRRPWFKGILRLAALACTMPQDAVNDAGIGNKGDDAHAAAAGAKQRIGLENLLNQPSPGTACFPGAIRIVALGKYRCRQAGAFFICGRHGNPGAIGVGAVK
jgi:hypothetical protein